MSRTEFYVELGTNIVRARVSAGLSQRDLAKCAGIYQSRLCRIEYGGEAKLIELVRLAAAMNVEPATLLPRFE